MHVGKLKKTVIPQGESEVRKYFGLSERNYCLFLCTNENDQDKLVQEILVSYRQHQQVIQNSILQFPH